MTGLDAWFGQSAGSEVAGTILRILDLHGGLQGLVEQFDRQGLGEIVSSWVGTHLSYVSGSSLPTDGAIRTLIPWDRQRALDSAAPARWTAPTGNSFAIDYAAEAGPRVDVRVQEVFGLKVHPTVGGVPLTLSLLSPGHRPVRP